MSSEIKVDTISPNANNQFVTINGDLYAQNVSVSDLIMTNEKPGALPNSVDGTKGHWIFQEGKDNLYIINKNNVKKYKIMLEEI